MDFWASGLSEVSLWVSKYGPLIGLVFGVLIITGLVLVVIELRRTRIDALTSAQSMYRQLHTIEDVIARQNPARYALAAYIAVNHDAESDLEELRRDLVEISEEWTRMEDLVEEVLRTLDDTEQRLGGIERI